MTPSQLRALLDAATKRPWMVEAIDDSCPYWKVVAGCREVFDDGSACGEYGPTCTDGDGRAIVATMNAADALHDLWSALRSTGYTYRPDSEDPVERRIADALRRLEELP